MIIATLVTLCGCTREMKISWPARTLRVPIPYGPRTVTREEYFDTPPPVREFEMRSYEPETRFMFGRATYREMA